MTKTHRRMMTASFRPQVTPLEDRTTPVAAFALSNNTLFSFDTASPAATAAGVPITGLGTGENLVGIDIRPQNGQLYGLTSTGAGAVRLYAISPVTGTAVPLSPAPVQFDDGGGNPIAINGTNFGIDFNPVVDRLRVVTDAGVNFRINPNTGAIIDGNGGGGITPGINPDGPVNGGTTTVDATAYTNNAPNATATTQYTLDSASNQLFIQTPPNSGTQSAGVGVTLGGSGLDFSAVNGFDIPAGVAVGTSGSAATGSAFAILTVGTGAPTLYSIDLSNGKATSIGAVSTGTTATPIQGFAVQPNSQATGVPFVGIAGNSVVRFNSLTPGTSTAATLKGLAVTEAVVGLDRRPATGQYLVLIHDSTTKQIRLATLDPQDGTTTQVGVTIALADAAGLPITFAAGTTFGIDINPTVDKLRVVTSTGVNFRIDPTTGAPVDTDTAVTGNQPDAALNGGSTKADATAYTNNFHKASVTTQYTLDASTDKLFIQNLPNAGTLTNGVAVTLNGTALDFTDATGFDIPSNVRVATANTAASGSGFVSLTVAGDTSLYAINLTSGAATKIGSIATGSTPVVGLSASEAAVSSTGLTGIASFVAGTDRGATASAKLYAPDQTVIQTIAPFAGFTGGVRTATADFNGDGIADIVVGTGPGIATDVRIFDGKTGTQFAQVNPFEAAFTGGVFVAAGDVTGDGVPELVITPDQGGGPRVRVFRNGNPTDVLADFFGIEDSKFRGGARAAIGDINGDGIGDIGVAAGFGGGPRVAGFDGTTLNGTTTPDKVFDDFFAFEIGLRNGVFLAIGDVDGDGRGDIIAGGGPGGGPRVTAFDGDMLVTSNTKDALTNFFAGDTANRGGIRVAVKNLDSDNKADIVVGSGTGAGTTITAYLGTTLQLNAPPTSTAFTFDAFTGTNGVFVG